MNEDEVVQLEAELRSGLRDLGLEWITTQVDEGLANEASETGDTPSAAHRLVTLAEAVAFAVEVADSTEAEILKLVDGEDLPSDQRPRVEAVRFVDPVAREVAREVPRDRGPRHQSVERVRSAADALTRRLRDRQ